MAFAWTLTMCIHIRYRFDVIRDGKEEA